LPSEVQQGLQELGKADEQYFGNQEEHHGVNQQGKLLSCLHSFIYSLTRFFFFYFDRVDLREQYRADWKAYNKASKRSTVPVEENQALVQDRLNIEVYAFSNVLWRFL